MKKLFVFFVGVLTSASCKKNDETPNTSLQEAVPEDAIVLATGNFTPAVHPTSGSVQLLMQENKYLLALGNFTTDNGPDLYIYLASSLKAEKFINLGRLKATRGNQLYQLNTRPDLEEYPYVLVWCQQFSVLFGSAKLSN